MLAHIFFIVACLGWCAIGYWLGRRSESRAPEKQRAPVEGERYVLHSDSPFRVEPSTCVITGVLSGWVRYALERRDGTLILDFQSDLEISTFIQVWTRLP